MSDQRGTRAWRVLRAKVIAEEPLCWLRLPGCTTISDTADHILTVKTRPDLALVRGNCRGCCSSCNSRRNDKPISALTRAGTAPALSFFD